MDARVPARVRHFDAAACGRPSAAVLAAQAGHLQAEAEYGGYVAEEQAEPLVCAGRAALARMIDPDALIGADVALFGSATSAFAALLEAWRLPPGASVGVVAFEYARNAALLSARATRDGLRLVRLPVDATGRLDLARLDRHGPDLAGLELVTLPHVASHRGEVQPVGELAARCAAAGVGLIVDAAQSLGQVELAPAAGGHGMGSGAGGTVWVGTSRKWLCGPRGVGFAAIGPDVVGRLHLDAPALAAARWPAAGLLGGEAAIAARAGWAQAVLELEAAGPGVLARLISEHALAVRRRLAEVPGWRVREPADVTADAAAGRADAAAHVDDTAAHVDDTAAHVDDAAAHVDDTAAHVDDTAARRDDGTYRPGGILTLQAEDGREPTAVRARLLADGVLTSAITHGRAPWEPPSAALRVSVGAWTTHADIDALADALAAAPARG